MRTYEHTYVHTYKLYVCALYQNVCMFICTYVSMCVPTCISVCRVIELETLTQVRSNLLLSLWRLLSVLMHLSVLLLCTNAKTHTHMHMYAHTYTTHVLTYTHMYSHTQTHTMFHVCIHIHIHTHVPLGGTVHLWVSHTYVSTYICTHIHNIQEQENTITSLNQQVSALEKEKLAAATNTIIRTVRMTPTHT